MVETFERGLLQFSTVHGIGHGWTVVSADTKSLLVPGLAAHVRGFGLLVVVPTILFSLFFSFFLFFILFLSFSLFFYFISICPFFEEKLKKTNENQSQEKKKGLGCLPRSALLRSRA